MSTDLAMDNALDKKLVELKHASELLQLISAHDALSCSETSCSAQKFMHIIRASPCAGHATINAIDETLRSCLTKIANVKVTDKQWTQATLPFKSGGLSLRTPLTMALPAFLAFVVSTQQWQEQLLRM
jgi:hypothetical protein